MKFKNVDNTVLMDIAARPDLLFVRGQGSYLWDNEGKRYLDFVQGWAVNCLGHSPSIISETLFKQSQLLITPSPAFYNKPAIQLATSIVDNSCFDRIFFANSGAEANEGAIKLARKWGVLHKNGAFEIITFDNSFHGRTLATMSASGKPQFRPLFEPKVPGFPKAELNDLDSVKRLLTEKTVAVMLEPVQGEAGVVSSENGFLQDLRSLTDQNGLLLIVDEIQTGLGRTGRLWGHQHAEISPDIMTLGKMLGGGVPLAALAATEAVTCFEHGDQGGTFNGNPLMTAVGAAVMDTVLGPGFLENVESSGDYLMQGLKRIADRYHLGSVRGKGLLLALDLKREIAQQVVETALTAGLILNSPRPSLLRFMPALNVSKEEIDAMLKILDRTIGNCLD